jgi:hypothetical protein
MGPVQVAYPLGPEFRINELLKNFGRIVRRIYEMIVVDLQLSPTEQLAHSFFM